MSFTSIWLSKTDEYQILSFFFWFYDCKTDPGIFLSAVGFEPPTSDGFWRFLLFQTLGIINIGEIYTRFAYTKRMVDLVNVPNARYNQGSQGLSTIIGGSVSTELPSVPSALFVFLLLRLPGPP